MDASKQKGKGELNADEEKDLNKLIEGGGALKGKNLKKWGKQVDDGILEAEPLQKLKLPDKIETN